ncbi:MAG: carbohydrate ABC transporter permease [Candidatus Izemoplasma sp.]
MKKNKQAMATIKENNESYKLKAIFSKTMVYVFLVSFGFFVILPFYWMVLTSFKSAETIISNPPILWLWPNEWELSNFSDAMSKVPYFRYMLNTVLVATLATIGTIFTTVLAAFAFARLNFKGRDTLFMLMLTTMMIPGEMYVITNYLTIADLGLLSDQTYMMAIIALTLPFMTSVFYMFFLRQTFRQIPDELYYAAKVDGTSDLKYLLRIMIPIAKPTIITITILNAMGTWNAYIWPRLVADQELYRLVTNGLRGAAHVDNLGRPIFEEQMAATLIVTLPLLIVFLFLKKYIMRGVSRSGIKG